MNQCQLMGRLVKDPVLRATPQGTSVASFTLAVDRRFKKDQADFINIIAWRQTAEFAAKYFRKGMRIAVTGVIQTRTWEDNGVKRYATEVVADGVYFADGKIEMAPQTAPAAPASIPDIPAQEQIPIGFEKLDEDVPF